MTKNYYTQDNMEQWRRWDEDLVEQCDREVRILIKVLAGLVLAVFVLVLMKVF